MESRRIQLVGNRSYSVSLPKEWVLANHLKEKDTIFIDITKDNEEVKKEVEMEAGKIDNITEFLMLCYVKNIDRIILKSDGMDYQKLVKIRNIINYLEGYDIVKEDEGKIEIAFLFNEVQITIPQIHRRMIYLLKLMFQAIENKDRQTCEDTENNIDRLYHLSKRIIISCTHNHRLQKENNVMNEEDLFFLKDISKKLEGIGDSLYELSSHKITEEQKKKIIALLGLVEDMFSQKKDLGPIKDCIRDMPEQRDGPGDLILNKMQDRCLDLFENRLSIDYNKKYFG